MEIITLQALPSQTFTLQADNNVYDITLKEVGGVIGFTLYVNNILVLSNSRAVSGELCIPYVYLQSGNFLISTLNDELPNYLEFGITQNLIYFSLSDLP